MRSNTAQFYARLDQPPAGAVFIRAPAPWPATMFASPVDSPIIPARPLAHIVPKGSSRAMADAACYPLPVDEHVFMPNYSALRFLIVDDNEINLRIFHRVLAKLFPNSAITTVQDLSRLPSLVPFHVIFLDIEMPVVTGVDIARRVRLLPSMDHVGLVAVTTRALRSDLELYERCGFDFTFPKPVDQSHGYILLQIERVLRARGY